MRWKALHNYQRLNFSSQISRPAFFACRHKVQRRFHRHMYNTWSALHKCTQFQNAKMEAKQHVLLCKKRCLSCDFFRTFIAGTAAAWSSKKVRAHGWTLSRAHGPKCSRNRQRAKWVIRQKKSRPLNVKSHCHCCLPLKNGEIKSDWKGQNCTFVSMHVSAKSSWMKKSFLSTNLVGQTTKCVKSTKDLNCETKEHQTQPGNQQKQKRWIFRSDTEKTWAAFKSHRNLQVNPADRKSVV